MIISNKIFKEMIKNHQVKQSFVVMDPEINSSRIYRFYQDTTNPENIYYSVWSIDLVNKKLQKEVRQVNKDVWQHNWSKYVNNCMHTDAYELDYFEKMLVEAPMYQRKYWKIKVDTVLFMLKDQRVDRSNPCATHSQVGTENTSMLNAEQQHRLNLIKREFEDSGNRDDDDYLDRLTDFMNDEAPDVVREAYIAKDYENLAVIQFEHEVFSGTPWETETEIAKEGVANE